MAETIKEFCVALGFNIDDSALRKFDSAILGAAAPVLKLGAAVVATTAVIETMVERVSREMNDLFYAAQRTGVAASTLQAVGYAAKQLGLDAGAGADLMEGFSRSMRMNPGMQGFLANLGGEFQTVNGQVGLTDKGLKNIITTMSHMKRYQALMYGQMIGLNPDTLNTILNNPKAFFDNAVQGADMARKMGLNLDDATAKGKEFTQHLGTMDLAFQDLGIRIGTDFQPKALALIDWITQLTVDFGQWNDKLGGTPGQIGAVTGAVGGLVAILKTLSLLPGFRWLAGFISAPVTAGAAIATVGAIADYTNVTEELAKPNPSGTAIGQGLTGEIPITGLGDLWHTLVGRITGGSAPTGRAIGILKGLGMGQEQATGVVGALLGEGPLDPGAVGDHGQAYGIAQWHPDRQKAFAAWAGHDIHGSSLDEQLGFASYELSHHERLAGDMLKHATTAKQAAEIFTQYDLRPAGGYDEAVRRGQTAANISVSQKTDIHVTGAGDPNKAASAVKDAQAGVNDSMARNLSGAVR